MSSSGIVKALAIIVVLAGTAACNKSNSSTSERSVSSTEEKPSTTTAMQPSAENAGTGAIDSSKAKEIFNSRCATCHGTEGRGNGPGAVTLNPKPRNYHDKEWQARVTDEEIKKTISYGGAAVGKSPMMPASPDLEAKPQVVAGLVQIVRDFGK